MLHHKPRHWLVTGGVFLRTTLKIQHLRLKRRGSKVINGHRLAAYGATNYRVKLCGLGQRSMALREVKRQPF